jgi:hypothetical protein
MPMNSLGRAASLMCAGMAVACVWWGLTVAQTPPASNSGKAANDQSAQPATKSNPEVRASKSIEILSITFRTMNGHVYSGTPATHTELTAAGLDGGCTPGPLQCVQGHIFRCAVLAGRTYWLNTNEPCACSCR